MSNPLEVLAALPPEMRQCLVQMHQATQTQAIAHAQAPPPTHPVDLLSNDNPPQIRIKSATAPSAPLSGQQDVELPARAPPPPGPALKFEQLAKFILYLHEVRESESYARLLLRRDVDEARFGRVHMQDRHRAAIEAEIERWQRSRGLKEEVLSALVVASIVVFDLELAAPLANETLPCSTDAFRRQDFLLVREDRISLRQEATIGVHSALLNRSKLVPAELFRILELHDAHHDYISRMRRRMRTLEISEQKKR